jgi:hypothetical protein
MSARDADSTPTTAALMCSQSPFARRASVGDGPTLCDAKRSLSVGGGRSGRNADDPVRVSATPCGASGLVVGPASDAHRSYSNTFPPHPLNQELQSSSGTNGKDRRSAARSLRRGRNDRRGRPPVRRPLAPLLWPGHRPFLPVTAQPQAGHALGAPKVRLVYRPEAVRLPQDTSDQR